MGVMTDSQAKQSLLAELVARAVGGERSALEAVVQEIQDDVYHLALRMLGNRADAEDATQEILIQVLTHLAQWRGEASFRTWVWRIGVRHILRRKQSKDELECSFEAIEGLLAAGESKPPLPALSEAELRLLERELRLACTEGMLLSLDRDHRVAWVLAELFELESSEAAMVLDIEPGAFRKRLQRARERLGAWMDSHCGLVNALNACNCLRQIPVAMEAGAISPSNIQFATHPVRADTRKRQLDVLAADADAVNRTAHEFCCQPDFAAPETVLAGIRKLIDSKSLRLLEA
jgi:RNA polymerase sigma factor (sigma-70 family)